MKHRKGMGLRIFLMFNDKERDLQNMLLDKFLKRTLSTYTKYLPTLNLLNCMVELSEFYKRVL